MKSFKQFLFEASKAQLLTLKDHFKSTEGLNDDQVNPYVTYWNDIISKLPNETIEDLNKTIDPKDVKNIQSFLPSKKKPQPKLSFKDLEQLVDAHKGRQDYTGREKEQTRSSGEEDIIYNKNNLIIKKGHSRQSCITHGKEHTWCISRPDSSNLYNRYRFDPDQLEPSFYFVYDKDKSNNDPWFHVVIYVRNDGSYVVALAHNPGDQEMSWNEIIQNQPKLKGLEKLFKHVPLTTDEKEMYEKFKDPISPDKFLNLSLKEMDFYIALGHELSENVMLELLKKRTTKAILNNYVIHQWLLPKKVYDKLTDGQKKKIENNQIAAVKNDGLAINVIIKTGYTPSEAVQIAAVNKNWRVIQIIIQSEIKPSKAVQVAAVKKDWRAIEYIMEAGIEPSEAVQLAAVENDGKAIKDIIKAGIKPSEKIISAAINNGWYDPPKKLYDTLSSEHKKRIDKNQFIAAAKYHNAIKDIIDAGYKPSEDVQFAKKFRKFASLGMNIGFTYINDIIKSGVKQPSETAISALIDMGWYHPPKEIYNKLTDGQKKKIENNQIAAVKNNWLTIQDIIDAGYIPPIKVISLAIDNGWDLPPKKIYDTLSSELKKKIEKNQIAAVEKYGWVLKDIINAGIEPSEAVQIAAVENNWTAIESIIDAGFKPSEAVQIAAVKKGIPSITLIKNVKDSVIKYIIDHDSKAIISDILSRDFKSQEAKQKLQTAFDEKYK